MQKLLIYFFFLSVACVAEEAGTKDVTNWLKEELSETLSQNQKMHPEGQGPIKKCATGIAEPMETNLLAFVSFSMPDETLLSLAKEIEQFGGVLVLRGLPENSFKELAKRLLLLKEKGLTASFQINPKLFYEYEITNVPAFVLLGKQGFDKVSGNISLEYALELFQSGKEKIDG